MTAPPPLLEIRNLRTWYPVRRGVFARTVDHIRAVDDVSLSILPGETLGVVGESGCGKSTLARSILRLEHPQSGTIRMEELDVLRLRGTALREYRRSVQVVFQDPFASMNPRHTILDQVTEGMFAQGLVPAAGRREAAARLLQDVGLGPDALDRYPHAFSGGQRQRICIARALALNPRLLICDEAVSALDLSVRAQVLNLLVDLRNRHRLAYLFITHDIGVVQHLADRIAVMYLGKIVELGPAEQVLGSPAHPYTRLLLDSVPRIGKKLAEADGGEKSAGEEWRVARGGGKVARALATLRSQRTHFAKVTHCPFAPRCPMVFDRCRSETPGLFETGTPDLPHQSACFRQAGRG